MSGRTVKDFQTLGVNRRLTRQMIADFPDATSCVFSGDVTESSQRLISRARARAQAHYYLWVSKGAITSKIKHAVKLKTSPARHAQLLQPSLGRPYGVTGGLIKCS